MNSKFVPLARGTCQFCGSRGAISRQHVFPRQISKLFPSADSRSTRHRVHIDNVLAMPVVSIKEIVRDNSGPSMKNKTISCACKQCNNEWMNKIECDAIGIIIEMANSALNFSGSDVFKLYDFLLIMFMVIDLDDFEKSAISVDERLSFRQGIRPERWHIFLGSSQIFRPNPFFCHRGGCVRAYREDGLVYDDAVHVSTFGFGRLIFHAISRIAFDSIGADPGGYERAFGVKAIDLGAQNVPFEELHGLDDGQIDRLVNFHFYRVAGDIANLARGQTSDRA